MSVLFKYLVVSVGVGISDVASLDVTATKPEMVTPILDSIYDANHLSKAVTARKLTKHHYKKLIPTGEILNILIASILLDDAIKYSLRQKLNELTKNILSVILVIPYLVWNTMYGKQNSNRHAHFLLATNYITMFYK